MSKFNQTYSEQRQQALFIAGRRMVQIACNVLDDTCQPGSVDSRDTVRWAIGIARKTADTARELIDQGHAETIATPHAETANRKAWAAYTLAISRFEKRVRDMHPEVEGSVIDWAGAKAYENPPRPFPKGSFPERLPSWHGVSSDDPTSH